MQREDVIQLARESGVTDALEYGESIPDKCLLRFARTVEQRTLYATLERAAQVCEEMFSDGALDIAAAIRALKENK